MRVRQILLTSVVLPMVYGCDGTMSPTQPTQFATAPAPAPAPAPVPAPVTGPPDLTISDVSLQAAGTQDGRSVYWVHFKLNEVSGRSGALIKAVSVSAPGAEVAEVLDESWLDWGVQVRVYAGGTCDASAPKGAASQAYSAPLIRSYGFPQFVVITVHFVDDAGQQGKVTSQVDLHPVRVQRVSVVDPDGTSRLSV